MNPIEPRVREWIETNVALLRHEPNMEQRTKALNRLIGAPTIDPNELHRRALLLTALAENGVWPVKGPRG